MNYFYKVIKNNKTIDKCSTHLSRRFLNNLRTINFQNNDISVYLKLAYCDGLTNVGIYNNKQELFQAFEAFREEE
jgi:hypothetical protein